MKPREVTATLVLFAATTLGCANTVDWGPIEYEPATGLQSPGKVSLFMDVGLANAVHSSSDFGWGTLSRWFIPYGERVHDFAETYLRVAFRRYVEVESPEVSGGMLVHITDVVYSVNKQAVRIAISIEARSSSGRPLLIRSYSAEAPSGAEAAFLGGEFARKQLLRRSTDRALYDIFEELIPDLQSAFSR